MTDWVGIILTVIIVLFLILLIWSRVQGDTIITILAEIRDLIKGEK